MENLPVLTDDWRVLLKMFPKNWKELAVTTKAMVRKLRNFENEESVMRALLLHIAVGYSLRETSTRLRMSKIADVSDVALLKRLQCSEGWLRELCLCLLREIGIVANKNSNTIRIRLVDGTNVKEPGKTGSLWRIHYSFTLPDLHCDYFKLTATEGKGTGESFKQFPVQAGDCIIGDRGYSTAQGIAYLAREGAYSLVRVNTASLLFSKQDKSSFNLLTEVKKRLAHCHEKAELEVMVNEGDQFIPGRLCIIRKSEAATKLAIKKLKRTASKKGVKQQPATLEFAKYVILFTTLPPDKYPLDQVLELYRFRWQIELIFKRLKSLAGLGHLPKHDDSSSRAWLYGKLLTGLLIEKLMDQAKNISPWGYIEQEDKKQMERI
jgi:hypothetical protein